jgi:DNA helicase HerA-like ATPase
MIVDFGKWRITKQQKASLAGPLTNDTLRVRWDEREMINGHMLVVGQSGTGKTHNIRKIVSHLAQSSRRNPLRIHVLDVHDDIRINGSSEVLFSESTDTGLNPLAINPDPHTGGVRKTIQNFIQTINKTSRQLGDRQQAVLRALLEELYAANGFYADKPESWSLGGRSKKFPNIDDLYRWTAYKYKQMFIGGSHESTSKLDKLNKEVSKLMKFSKGGVSPGEQEKFCELKDDAIDAYSSYITSIKDGREMEAFLKFDSKTTLKSVLDRIENLKNSGIFRNQEPDFDPSNPVWRYRIKNLSDEEKKMLVHFRLKELYDKALQRGEQDRIVEVIVIDEANMFMDNDPDNIISKMANEIRKFGTALLCASQSFTHFTEDFLASVATKVVLGIDEMYWDKTSKQLQIKKENLGIITPRQTALINMKRNIPPGHPAHGVKWFYTELNS